MNRVLEDSLIDLLVRLTETAVTADSIVDWATDALMAGEDTPSLIILAGLPRDSSLLEATPYLDKTLAELGIVVPPPTELRRAYVGTVSRALLAGRITSEDALDSIHRLAVSPLGHPPDLAAWCFVWERLDPTDFRELPPSDVDREARRLAATWAGHAGLMTRLHLFRFGYSRPEDLRRVERHPHEDLAESSEMVFIRASSESDALQMGSALADAFVQRLFGPSAYSWQRLNFAHWIESDPGLVEQALSDNTAILESLSDVSRVAQAMVDHIAH